MVLQLVKKEQEDFFLARIFFDQDDEGEEDKYIQINYQKVFVQPGIVAFTYPVEKGQPNFVKCV